MNKGEREARAARLREFLATDDVQAAMDAVEQDIIEEWRRSTWKRTREARWNELRGFERLRSKLASYAGPKAR